MKGNYTNFKIALTVSIILLILYSCANVGMPSGGAYDLDPPKIERIRPKANSTNVIETQYVFDFDENVVLDNPSEKVIITPPQRITPIIRHGNRRVTVTLRDSLIPNTTYSIDFTDAIKDNNEGNILENFSYTFSTGDHLDTLAISGIILQADNLEPVKGMLVGLHSNISDTAFTNLPFERISRTNDYGKFTVRGIAPGEYKIYGLADINRDYKYDNPDEAIAFIDDIIIPYTERAYRNDTVRHIHEDLTVDSISTVEYTHFYPDNIVLRSFKSDFKRKYLAKSERVDSTFSIFFGAPTEMPKFRALNFDKWIDEIGIMEKSLRNDTIVMWLTDKKILAQDTLKIEMTYLKTDTLSQDQIVVDTLSLFDRTRKRGKKKDERKIEEEHEIEFLSMSTNLRSSWDIYNKIVINFGKPLKSNLAEHLQLSRVESDSILHKLDLQLEKDSLNPRKYTISNKWDYGTQYQLSMDSAAIYSIYGDWNSKYEYKFRVKRDDEYGNLILDISGISDTIPAFVELLTASDTPAKKSNVRRGRAVFRDIPPGTYYARIVLDTNGNGKWDTGSYENNRQAEMVSYFPRNFEIRGYFDITEPWNVDTLNLEGQKPLEITKNKPADKEDRMRKMEEREQERQRQGGRR